MVNFDAIEMNLKVVPVANLGSVYIHDPNTNNYSQWQSIYTTLIQIIIHNDSLYTRP